MKKLSFLLAICTLIYFTSCSDREEIEDAVVHFDLAIEPSTNISSIDFGYTQLRVTRTIDGFGQGNSIQTRRIVMDNFSSKLNETHGWKVPFGQTLMEPTKITNIELIMSCEARIVQNGISRNVHISMSNSCLGQNANIYINSFDDIRVTLLLDLKLSSLVIVDGVETLFPEFRTIVEENTYSGN